MASIPNPYAGGPGDTFIFVASSTASGRNLFFTLFYDNGSPVPRDTQLWRTDGSRSGTVLLHQPLIPQEEGLLVPKPAPTDDGRVVFHAYDTAHGHEPWVSDGTPSGTRLLQDLLPGPGSSYPQELLRAGDFIYFIAKLPVYDREIWALPVPRVRRGPDPF